MAVPVITDFANSEGLGVSTHDSDTTITIGAASTAIVLLITGYKNGAQSTGDWTADFGGGAIGFTEEVFGANEHFGTNNGQWGYILTLFSDHVDWPSNGDYTVTITNSVGTTESFLTAYVLSGSGSAATDSAWFNGSSSSSVVGPFTLSSNSTDLVIYGIPKYPWSVYADDDAETQQLAENNDATTVSTHHVSAPGTATTHSIDGDHTTTAVAYGLIAISIPEAAAASGNPWNFYAQQGAF